MKTFSCSRCDSSLLYQVATGQPIPIWGFKGNFIYKKTDRSVSFYSNHYIGRQKNIFYCMANRPLCRGSKFKYENMNELFYQSICSSNMAHAVTAAAYRTLMNVIVPYFLQYFIHGKSGKSGSVSLLPLKFENQAEIF